MDLFNLLPGFLVALFFAFVRITLSLGGQNQVLHYATEVRHSFDGTHMVQPLTEWEHVCSLVS